MTIKIQGDKITFPDDSEQTTAYVGSSGGGSTPEALVWEDKTAERVVDTVYTNTNDVPLYIDLYFSCVEDTYFETYINDNWHGTVGRTLGSGGGDDYQKTMLIVPANQTYKVVSNGTVGTYKWYEARMPLAVAVGGASGGGETVALNTLLTSAQVIPHSLKTTIFYDDTKLDTDSNYNSSTGKYTIPSDGIYRIGASVNLKKDNSLIDSLAYLNINSEVVQRNRFDYTATTDTSSSFMAVNIDYVADLKKGDEVYISAYGRTKDNSDLELLGGLDVGNVFNIIKVSGGSASGGGTPSSFARIVDEKPQGVDAGASVSGIQQRTLNKIVSDDDSIVTLAEDKSFTLQAGTYVIDYSAPVFQSNYTKIYLHSVTDNATADNGTSGYNEGGYSSGRYGGQYIVTLTSPHTYQVQQYIQNPATNGLGLACTSGVGIFATVDIEKVGSGGSGGGTLDIDALPELPTELEGTDLFVTERTGTNYKVSADELKG